MRTSLIAAFSFQSHFSVCHISCMEISSYSLCNSISLPLFVEVIQMLPLWFSKSKSCFRIPWCKNSLGSEAQSCLSNPLVFGSASYFPRFLHRLAKPFLCFLTNSTPILLLQSLNRNSFASVALHLSADCNVSVHCSKTQLI